MADSPTTMRRPTRSPWPALFCFALAGVGGAMLRYVLLLPGLYDELLIHVPAVQLPFMECNMAGVISGLRGTLAVATAVCISASLLGLIRYAWALSLIRGAFVVAGFALLVCVGAVMRVTAVFLEKMIPIEGMEPTPVVLFFWRWHLLWPVWAVIGAILILYLLSWRRAVIVRYTGIENEHPAAGDRVLEDLRTNGREPLFRKSLYGSMGTHLMILVVIPILLNTRGCVEPYRIPKGSGTPAVAVQMVKVTKVQKKHDKKRKHHVLNPNSAIIFEIPDLDNAEVDQVMEEQTQVTYQSMASATAGKVGKAGKMGKGGGTSGGWPEGMEDYRIRFIRLNHGGPGWDDGMDSSDADVNFLRAFARDTGFKRIASKGESHSIALLGRYPKDAFPPFVYMTGNGGMGRTTIEDVRALRDYCMNGGLLIADAGSPEFHNSFMHFIRQVFPDKPLVDIADDDMLYQLPFAFPNGAPSFWHHGGRRASGIKHEGRWIVFYHPGDMNDAWKSPGYTDVTPEMREAALQLGINLVYYAFTQWDDAVAKAKK